MRPLAKGEKQMYDTQKRKYESISDAVIDAQGVAYGLCWGLEFPTDRDVIAEKLAEYMFRNSDASVTTRSDLVARYVMTRGADPRDFELYPTEDDEGLIHWDEAGKFSQVKVTEIESGMADDSCADVEPGDIVRVNGRLKEIKEIIWVGFQSEQQIVFTDKTYIQFHYVNREDSGNPNGFWSDLCNA